MRAPSDIRLGEALEGAEGRLEQELASIAAHRWHLPYEEADGQHRFTLDGGEHPLGRLVRSRFKQRRSARELVRK